MSWDGETAMGVGMDETRMAMVFGDGLQTGGDGNGFAPKHMVKEC